MNRNCKIYSKNMYAELQGNDSWGRGGDIYLRNWKAGTYPYSETY